ncbi:MAG TPA: hypothetical protein VG870_07650 [Chitinophagaceae bacterium]|nr:hypothetical protein [Chitinophagaceae bacterium]
MKRIFYSFLLSMILVGGLFVGMVRGQEVRQRWVARMKTRYEERERTRTSQGEDQLMLDEFEMSAYHS